MKFLRKCFLIIGLLISCFALTSAHQEKAPLLYSPQNHLQQIYYTNSASEEEKPKDSNDLNNAFLAIGITSTAMMIGAEVFFIIYFTRKIKENKSSKKTKTKAIVPLFPLIAITVPHITLFVLLGIAGLLFIGDIIVIFIYKKKQKK